MDVGVEKLRRVEMEGRIWGGLEGYGYGRAMRVPVFSNPRS